MCAELRNRSTPMRQEGDKNNNCKILNKWSRLKIDEKMKEERVINLKIKWGIVIMKESMWLGREVQVQ